MRTFGEAPPPPTLMERLKSGLSRSTGALGANLAGVFSKKKLDAETVGELEEALIAADLGGALSAKLAGAVAKGRYDREISEAELRSVLAAEIAKVLAPVEKPFQIDATKKPFIVLVAGVNGTGKTTTIGKIAKRLTGDGHKIVLAAGDTFRAAAIEQLQVWGQRTGAEVVARAAGADAAGLAFDAIERARRQRRRCRPDRHRRPPAEQGGADGRTGKDRARHQEARCGRAACGAAGAGRDHGTERDHPGGGLSRRRAADRPGHDQARRHRQGRHPGGAGRQVRPARPLSSASAKRPTICKRSRRKPSPKR